MAGKATEASRRQAPRARPTRLPGDRQAPPNNLPAAPSSFVGRRRELATVAQAVDGGRLVTLVGPGGVGKSRLGLEAARRRLMQHPDGLWLVDLAGLTDGAL